MEDRKIIALLLNRDGSALAAMEEKYGSYCFQIALNILQDREDSAECVNDTWLRAWQSIPPAEPKDLRHFLAKITRNLALDRYRVATAAKRGGGSTALALEELSQCISGKDGPEESYYAKQLQEAINRFVKKLPQRDGNIFIRRYFFLETAGEIAARYAISENLVAVILSRSWKKLHTFLVKEGFLHE